MLNDKEIDRLINQYGNSVLRMKIATNQCKNQLRSQWFQKIISYEEEQELENKT